MERGRKFLEIISDLNSNLVQKRIRNANIQDQKILKFNREKLIRDSNYYNPGSENIKSIKSNNRNFLHHKYHQSNPNSGLNSLTSPSNSYFIRFINPNQSGLHSSSTVELNYHSNNRSSSRNAKFEDEMKRNGLLSDIWDIQSMNTIIEKDFHKNQGKNDSDISEYLIHNISPRYQGSSSQKALNNDQSIIKKIYFSYQRNHRELSPEKILKKQSKKIGISPMRINRDIISQYNNLNQAILIDTSNHLLDLDGLNHLKKNKCKEKLSANPLFSKRIGINFSKNKDLTPDKIPMIYLKSFSDLTNYWRKRFGQDYKKIDLSQVKYTNRLLSHPEKTFHRRTQSLLMDNQMVRKMLENKK